MQGTTNKILPSEFRRRITVKRPNSITDDSGGTSNSGYTARFTTWAKIEQMRTQEKVLYGMDAFNSAFQITTRYNSDRNFTVADLIDYLDGTDTKTLVVKSVQLVNEDYKKFNIIIANEFSVNG